LPLAKRHVRRGLQDARAGLSRMLEMLVNVVNMHSHVLAYFIGARGPKLGTLPAQHHGALGNVELRMGQAATRNPSS
jgi:hypothetical protein